MSEPATDTRFLSLATPLLGFVAGVHLARGVSGLINGDPSPATLLVGFVAFGLLGIVAVTGIESALLPPKFAYTLGICLMATSLFAYADIHALHLVHTAIPVDVAGGHTHAHAHSPVRVLTAHLRADVTALLLKTLEFTTMTLLLIAAVRHGVDGNANA